jgi:hypothetical protein
VPLEAYILDPPVCLEHVGIVGVAQRVRVEAFVCRYGARAAGLLHEALEVLPVPVAREVAIVDKHRLGGDQQMLHLTNCMDRAELVGRNPDHPPAGGILLQRGFHPVRGLVQMILIADEDEVRLTRKHVYDMCHDGLAFHFNQGLGLGVSRAAKSLSEAGHGDDNLHRNLR